MGTIVIRRPNDGGGHFRRLKVFIDGVQVAGLRPNRSHTAEVTVGIHQVQARMDWVTCNPLTIDITSEQVITVEVSLPFSAAIKSFTDPKHAVQARRL